MRHLWVLLALALAAIPAGAQQSLNPSRFTPPNVAINCGTDGTSAIQTAVNANSTNLGTVTLPPCPSTNPIFISSTILLPSNISVIGSGRSVTWLKAVNSLNAPMFENANFAGGASQTLNTNIELGFLNLDGNGSNQSHVLGNYCIYLLGVDRPSVHDIEVDNCDSTAVHFDGNSSTTTNGGFVNNIFVNTTFGTGSNPLSGVGLKVSNAQRGMQVSNVTTLNTAGYGVLLDASEGNWSSIHTKGSGTGLTCPNSGTTTVDNPGGGGASQSNWTPCAAGIYVRNVSDVNGVNFLATDGQFYGIVIVGARHTTLASLTATGNSQKTSGVWDDLHIDLNVFLSSGRGENHNLAIDGAVLGSNTQLNVTNASSAPSTRYGLFINDGLAGSAGDAQVVGGGTTCTINDALTASGGTFSVVSKWIAGNVSGGVVTGIKHDFTTGSGVYTVLPTNPVTLTGGTCGTNPTINITWSKATITGVSIGQTVTAATRIPAFFTNWYVSTNAGNFGPRGLPTLSSCGTSPSLASGATDNLGKITVGTTTGTCTLTFAQPFSTRVFCSVTSGTALATFAYTYTLSAITATATTLDSDLIDYRCDGV